MAPKVFCRREIQLKLHRDTVFDLVSITRSEALKSPFFQVLLETLNIQNYNLSPSTKTLEVNYKHE